MTKDIHPVPRTFKRFHCKPNIYRPSSAVPVTFLRLKKLASPSEMPAQSRSLRLRRELQMFGSPGNRT